MSSDTESEGNSAKTPPKKKTKNLCVYLRKWEEQYSWLKIVPSNVYRAIAYFANVSSALLMGVIPTADNILAQKGINERKGM
jgi:hypothetical protein